MDKKAGASNASGTVSIAAVERETGLSKDTLRVWERRYGFPKPRRDSNGEREYSRAQLEKLRLIRRCMDLGLRPGKIVAAPVQELSARLHKLSGRMPDADDGEAFAEIIAVLKTGRVGELRDCLTQLLMQRGLRRFLLEVVAPASAAVGQAWLRGEIEIHEEHVYAEQINQLLRQAIGNPSQAGVAPRVLLTTLPGEQHQLGMLMAQAWLSTEGVHCISLGVQTPAFDIVRAASALEVDIVGISFSLARQPRAVAAHVAELREGLKPQIELWAGGSILGRMRNSAAGVCYLPSLADITPALTQWRAHHAARAA